MAKSSFFFIKNPLYSILIVIVLKLIINRKRPIQKYNIKPVDDLKRRNYSFQVFKLPLLFLWLLQFLDMVLIWDYYYQH